MNKILFIIIILIAGLYFFTQPNPLSWETLQKVTIDPVKSMFGKATDKFEDAGVH